MSFLDTIKNLFFRKNAEEIEEKQSTETEVTPEPVIEPELKSVSEPEQKVEVAVEAEVKVDPVVEPEIKANSTVEPDLKSNTVLAGLKTPEDSTLRRHFLANLEAEKQPKFVEPQTPAVEKKQEEATIKVTETSEELIEKGVVTQIPQDSALKRHYISALKYKIEDSMSARPTDSALKRHYNAAVQAELDNLLAGD